MLTDSELKEKLIAKISNTGNVDLLKELLMITEIEEQMEGVYHLSSEEIIAVNDGINQIDKGLFLSNDEANVLIDKCLGR